MRFLLSIVVALVLVIPACGGPKFADEHEELAYLTALSNPTVEQFRRRVELKGKADAVWKEESGRIIQGARKGLGLSAEEKD